MRTIIPKILTVIQVVANSIIVCLPCLFFLEGWWGFQVVSDDPLLFSRGGGSFFSKNELLVNSDGSKTIVCRVELFSKKLWHKIKKAKIKLEKQVLMKYI